MLQFLRKSVSSWVGILILSLALGALVLTLFQGQGPGGQAPGSGRVLATIGKRTVSESEYLAMVDRAVQQERQRQPGLTNPDFIAGGGGEMVLRQLVAGQAMSAFAESNDMGVSRRMIDGEIASIPAFQVNGKFDETTFRRLIAQQQLTEGELRTSIEGDLLRRQLLQPVVAGVAVPHAMAEPYAALLLEVRRGSILPVPSLSMADPGTPTDAQLKAFHQENRALYTVPERRSFRYAEFDRTLFHEAAKPTPEQVREYFDKNKDEFGGEERREIRQVVLPDAAKADAFVKAVRGGKPFLEAALAEGFEAGDTVLGEHSRSSLESALSADAAKAAFAAEKGVVINPVQTSVGFHVMEVTNVVPAALQPFSTVQAQIEQQLHEARTDELLSEKMANAEDRLQAGESLADVAKILGLAVQTAPGLTADGRLFAEDYSFTKVEQPLLGKVFDADAADGPHVVELGQGRYAILELVDVTAPELAPLDKIRADVQQAWQIKARSDAARKEADRIAAALSKGEPLAAVTKGLNLPPAQELSVRRLELTQMAQQGQNVPPPVLTMLNTPKGQARVMPAPGGQGWFVVKVNEVVPGNIAEAPELVDAVRQSLGRDAGNELADVFVRTLERTTGVAVKPAAVKAVNSRLAGQVAE